MYKNLVPLRHTEHAGLRLLPVSNYDFASELMLAPIVVDELAEAAREYPIVFPRDAALPAVLLGVQRGRNAYVGDNGQWLASYVPAHIRHYPFMLTRLPGKGDGQDHVVMMDADSPLWSKIEGEPVFDGESLTPVAQRSVDLLRAMSRRQVTTRAMVQAIAAAGLFVERTVRVKRPGHPDARVSGLRAVDEKAFNALSDEAFNALRKSGALPLVYAHLLSWANFRQGPIGRA
ncbi:SapC family protein [Hydrogenophaga sp. BPS33]|uniref:SapC family protein n=1 Tax=Hydrogenophaga sp. BPS33 TaxID=2651974 RepID=UPI00135ACC79|nr:SapC family protein [Hydrogenophaga sp. BPS33]